MGATKEVKALLDELRGKLDKDQAAYLEPILRKILEAAKPKTVTHVEYRSDPKDKEEIESLRAEVRAKTETIRNLEFRLASPPPLFDHMSLGGLLEEFDEKAKIWSECSLKCMEQMARDNAARSRRKILLERCLSLAGVSVGNYLVHLEGLRDKIPPKKLLPIVRGSGIQWYRRLAQEVYAASGVKVDLSLPPPGDYVASVANATSTMNQA